MEYVKMLNKVLSPVHTEKDVNVLDLFAGCGGLALGFEAAGFKTIGFEMEAVYAETYRNNLNSECFATKLYDGFDYPIKNVDIIIGGPPCQPFSVGGYQNGVNDSRNGFPIFIDAIQRLKPKVWMFENVRGLLYTNKWYFEHVVKELHDLGYIIDYQLLNAVNYGIPQNRERLFVFGHKSKSKFMFPKRSPRKINAGEAVGDLMYTVPENSKFLTKTMDDYVARYEKASDCINPRDLYPDRPARTLTCRNLAGATGDMHRVRLPDGRRRRLSVREAARLQSFPDWFVFHGNESQQFNQIGNAVPPYLAYQLALSLKECYHSQEFLTETEIRERKMIFDQTLTLF
ncbi:MAG TPA: DNA cytosine methyltransferase [Bacteroidales bacterium]|nr:DNA cytosine methyltransferase [Bacteroidales bacterium]